MVYAFRSYTCYRKTIVRFSIISPQSNNLNTVVLLTAGVAVVAVATSVADVVGTGAINAAVVAVAAVASTAIVAR